jgi:hypothetical protein
MRDIFAEQVVWVYDGNGDGWYANIDELELGVLEPAQVEGWWWYVMAFGSIDLSCGLRREQDIAGGWGDSKEAAMWAAMQAARRGCVYEEMAHHQVEFFTSEQDKEQQ